MKRWRERVREMKEEEGEREMRKVFLGCQNPRLG